jgi:hypothetical protein
VSLLQLERELIVKEPFVLTVLCRQVRATARTPRENKARFRKILDQRIVARIFVSVQIINSVRGRAVSEGPDYWC